jgi:hypothetical protein
MGYNKYKKLEQLREDLDIQDINENWLPKSFVAFSISESLKDSLAVASMEGLGSEKAKSEQIVTPILRELRKHNIAQFKSFSGYEFDVDSSKNLNGYCDFILSLEHNAVEITAPIFCIVEARDDKIEKGYAQCGAAMYAAQIFNERKGKPKKAIYGCVTNAFSWCFLKLEAMNLYIDPNFVPLTFKEPHRVLSVLQWILDESIVDKP